MLRQDYDARKLSLRVLHLCGWRTMMIIAQMVSFFFFFPFFVSVQIEVAQLSLTSCSCALLSVSFSPILARGD
jgi:hypothetical protein